MKNTKFLDHYFDVIMKYLKMNFVRVKYYDFIIDWIDLKASFVCFVFSYSGETFEPIWANAILVDEIFPIVDENIFITYLNTILIAACTFLVLTVAISTGCGQKILLSQFFEIFEYVNCISKNYS